MSRRLLKEHTGRIFEAKKDDKTGRVSFPVIIISQGLGNLVDKNYYSAQAIESGVQVYEGKKTYFDHPTPTQEREQPGRSVRELCGHYENCKTDTDEQGLRVLKAEFVPISSNEEVIGLIEHSVAFKQKYPDKDYIGISINGDGEGKEMDYDSFVKEIKPNAFEMEKISQIQGQSINVITKLTDAVSADLVTEPGARGRILIESQKLKRKRRKTMFIEGMKKLLAGLAGNNKALTEEAVKDMLQDEGADKAEEGEKEKEAEMKQAEGMVKALLAAKKEMKKEEGESEEKYEARCMQSAMAAMKKEKESADKGKDAEEKKEDFPPKKDDKAAAAKDDKKADDGDGDDDSKEKKESKSEADGDKDKDKKDDMADMKKENEALKKEIESLKKEKESAKEESSKQAEESAKTKIILMAKEREEFIDQTLRATGLPRHITDVIRPVIASKNTKEQIKQTAKALAEAHSKGVESLFLEASSGGFTEISGSKETKSTDHLF